MRFIVICAIWLFPGTCAVAGAQGDTTVSVRSLTTTPIAPRGGVMMLPLGLESDDPHWPQRLPLDVNDGRTVEGIVIWIGPREARSNGDDISVAGRWTDDPRGLVVNANPGEEMMREHGRPFLLARMPLHGNGPIMLGEQRLEPVWHDLPTRALQQGGGRDAMPRTPALDRPDPSSPFEHWRWVLLAERHDQPAPGLEDFDPGAALLAQHVTDLWQIGLARLEVESYGLAQHVREALTRICHDDDVAFAAWVVDPVQMDGLLGMLLNLRQRGEALTGAVLAWLDVQERVRMWIESDAGDRVRLAIVNPGFRPAIVRLNWQGIDQPPLAVEVQAGAMRRVTVDRPQRELMARRPLEQLMRGERDRSSSDVLLVESDGRELVIPFGPRAASVHPPGLWLPMTRPPLSLAEVQGGRAALISPEYGAIAHVRRLRERWEVYIEVRRPQIGLRANDDERPHPTSIDVVRGSEAVILKVGENVTLIVPEHGWHHLMRGVNDGSLQIHRQSHHDRWVCRIVLPDAWLNTLPGEYTRLAVMRTRKGTPRIDSSPKPTLPWRSEPGGIALDLSEWRDHPLVGR